MKHSRKHRSSQRFNNDLNDKTDIIKSIFEWFGFVIIVVTLAGLVFSFVFRISEVNLKDDENVSVIVSSIGYSAGFGDEVAVRNDNSVYTAYVIALSGQNVTTYDNYDIAVDGVLMKNIHQVKSIRELCGNKMKIPDGYVLILSDNSDKSKKYKAELVSEDSIFGKVYTIVYPIKYFGKTVNNVRK